MDYGRFTRICEHIYKTVDTKHFRFEDCMKVFSLYFDAYRDFMGVGHPVPSYRQIAAIMEKMPIVEDENSVFDLEPESYEVLIPAYFLIEFNCDRNISHFFSGKIRLNRYYENLY